ncbi:MAG: thioredoxin family protein [Sphingobium sp.]|nr:thioredoxin family protein [Sphingobium sp.]
MKLRFPLQASLVLAMLSGAALVSAAPAPRVSVSSVNGLRQPLPLPYDERADANKDVAAAKARAKAQGKKLIIDLGGNWCADCRILAGVMELPEVRAFVQRHYVVVTVDVGHFDRNEQIPAMYGVKSVKGVPALMIVDPKTDKLLNGDKLSALADARSMTPQALADWLALWV